MQPNIFDNNEQGYIALISAIVISILLIAITFTLSFSGFFARFNILDHEYKKVSSQLAEACINSAMLKLAGDPAYAGNETVTIETGKQCTIRPITPAGTSRTIQSQAIYNKAYTNLEVVVILSATNVSVSSWKELPNL